MNLIPDHADYSWIRERLVFRVEEDRRAGGDRAHVAPFHQRLVDEHDTSAHERGEPCDSCGQPWPCGTVLGVLAPE